MVAVHDDPATVTSLLVEPPGQPNPQPLHPPGQGLAVLGLDDEVQVMSQQGEVDDAKDAHSVGGQDAQLDDAGELAGPQPGQVPGELEADVHGPSRREPWFPQVRHPG